ncbi:competence protein CoiA family protein [Kitasatospora sp. NPDC059795]|uniref:competence protein CoiA family protein n=1 Tax=Kitasatospora sp. NPDC059795 TaxID=3346949 RepID=UPI00364CEF86
MAVVDSRRVQTAVIGGPDSDRPVIVPEQPHNLDEFRRHYGTDGFWCGTQLGGCGEKLMTKRYEHKVCHFSHFPDHDGTKPACHRSSTGAESADHLFIKRDVKAWLADQGHLAQADLCSLGHGSWDAVDFWLRATGQHLRFALRPGDYRNWRQAVESLGAKTGRVEWVFGHGGAVMDDMVARRGYALRVRCETQGSDRRVLIGLVTDGTAAVQWVPLESCRMTVDGLVHPALDALRSNVHVRAAGETPFPATLPLRDTGIVFAVDPASAPPAPPHLVVPGRYLVAVFAKAPAGRIVRAYVSLAEAVPVPTEHFVYRLSGTARLLVDDFDGSGGSGGWAIHTDGLTALNGLDAERTGLWRPEVALEDPASADPPTPAAKDVPPLAGTGPDSAPRSPLAELLRGALIEVAREGRSTSWEELSGRIAFDLSHMPDPKRRSLLVEVDQPLLPQQAPLCVLVKSRSGRVLPYLPTVLRQLDASAPVAETAFRRWCERAVREVHTRYSPASASTPIRRARLDAEEPPTVQELRRALSEALALRPRTEGRRAKRLAAAIPKAERQLRDFETARARGVVALPHSGVLDELTRVLGHAVPATPTAAARSSADRATRTAATARPERTAAATDASKTANVAGPARDAGTKHAAAAGPTDVPPARRTDPPSPVHAALAAGLAHRFAEARAADDLSAAAGIREELAHALGMPGLPRQTAKTLRRLAGDLHQWIASRETDDVLLRIRALLESARRAAENGDRLARRSALAHARILRRKVVGGVPQDLQELFELCSRTTIEERPGRTAAGHALPEATLVELAGFVGPVLRDVARHQSTITWSGISRRLERELPRLQGPDQRDLLTRIDASTPADEPLLSALVVTTEHTPLPIYREVAARLGRELPRVPDGLHQHWQMDVLRLHSLWRHRRAQTR